MTPSLGGNVFIHCVHEKGIKLSDTKPSFARVGWMRPTYNRLPRRDLLIESGGVIFSTGIYAHAPAEHRYDLGGKWNRLKGLCGLASGSRGSVVFVISLDGKEKWRSRTTKSGALRRYDIDLTGAKELRLTVEDAGDGTGSDWGLWLAPHLSKEP